MSNEKPIKTFLLSFLAVTVAIVISALWNLIWSFPMMWAWNYVMPYVWNLPTLNWGRMFCLSFILSSLWKVVGIVTPGD